MLVVGEKAKYDLVDGRGPSAAFVIWRKHDQAKKIDKGRDARSIKNLQRKRRNKAIVSADDGIARNSWKRNKMLLKITYPPQPALDSIKSIINSIVVVKVVRFDRGKKSTEGKIHHRRWSGFAAAFLLSISDLWRLFVKGCVRRREAVKRSEEGCSHEAWYYIHIGHYNIYPMTGSHFSRVCLNSKNVTAAPRAHTVGMLLVQRVLIRVFSPTVLLAIGHIL